MNGLDRGKALRPKTVSETEAGRPGIGPRYGVCARRRRGRPARRRIGGPKRGGRACLRGERSVDLRINLTHVTMRSSRQGCGDLDRRGQGLMNRATLGDVQ